jgi:hypothetical protein
MIDENCPRLFKVFDRNIKTIELDRKVTQPLLNLSKHLQPLDQLVSVAAINFTHSLS